jgi:hypothetical protein
MGGSTNGAQGGWPNARYRAGPSATQRLGKQRRIRQG